MSDGNFNRSMLPSNNFQSGVRAGQARMQQFALEALATTLQQHPECLSQPAAAEQILVSTTRPPQVVGRFFCALSNQECTTQLL